MELAATAQRDSRKGYEVLKAFVTVPGQFDNVGDTLHRRVLLDWLRGFAELNVYIGEAPDSFVSGLNLRDSDTLYRSISSFLVSAATSSRLSGPDVLFVFNPGEIRLGRQRAIRELALAPLLWQIRRQGGQVLRPGIAVGPAVGFDGRVAQMTLASAIKSTDVLSWRESSSREMFSTGDIVPDLGFGVRGVGFSEDADSRNSLVVTMRFDRPMLSESTIKAISNVATEEKLEIVVTSQVRRDNERSAHLADLLGGTYDPWPDTRDHRDQESHLRSLYARTSLIVSDRLHALITAGTEGAAVFGLAPQNSDKLRKHFFTIGLDVGMVDDISSAEHVSRGLHETLAVRTQQNEAFSCAFREVTSWLEEASRQLTTGTRGLA